MSSLPAVRAWAAIRTKSRCEKVVATWLENHNVAVFLPLIRRRRVYEARVRWSHLPLFPGYLFYDSSAIDSREVFASRRVAQILSADNPAELKHDLDNVARALAKDDTARRIDFDKPGMPVEVIAGPLRGIVGTFIRQGTRCTLVIHVRLLSLAAELTIDEAFVRPLG